MKQITGLSITDESVRSYLIQIKDAASLSLCQENIAPIGQILWINWSILQLQTTALIMMDAASGHAVMGQRPTRRIIGIQEHIGNSIFTTFYITKPLSLCV